MERNGILVVGGTPEIEDRLGSVLGPRLAMTAVADVASARRQLLKGAPTVAVVALGGAPESLALIREIAAQGSLVVGLGPAKDPELILAALRAGAREFVVAGEEQELEKRLEGFGELFRMLSFAEIGSAAMLSRAVAGVRGRTLIVNLPGSPGGARENLAAVLPAIPHAIEKIRGEGGDCVPPEPR